MIWESLYIFLRVNLAINWFLGYRRLITSIQFIIYLCVIRNFNSLLFANNCNVAVDSISIIHQNSIIKTPFTHFISLRRRVFFSLHVELT